MTPKEVSKFIGDAVEKFKLEDIGEHAARRAVEHVAAVWAQEQDDTDPKLAVSDLTEAGNYILKLAVELNRQIIESGDVLTKIVGKHTDKGFDDLLKANLSWKIEGMNGKKLPVSDEGQVPNRVLVTLWEETIESARMG